MTEDLSTYTEVDLGFHLSKTASRVTASDVQGNTDAYVYKDFGTSYFDNINLQFSIRLDYDSTEWGGANVGFANNVDDANHWSGTTLSVAIYVNMDLPAYIIEFGTDYCIVSPDTTYYCTLIRTGNTATLQIYTDAERTTLFDTLSVSGLSTTKWRYFYPFVSSNDGDTEAYFTGYTENFLFLGGQFSSTAQIIGLEAW